MRIRTVKPEFWCDEDLSSVSSDARLLAIGLLNLSDDEGYFVAHPGVVRSAIFPLIEPPMNIHGLLMELSRIGYIRLYKDADGRTYGHVVNFLRHQVISRPKPSNIREKCIIHDESMIDHGSIHDESMGKEGRKEGNKEPPNPPNGGIECDEKKSIDPTSRKAMILDAQAEHGVKPLRDDPNHTEFILTKWNMLAHRDLPKCKTWTMAHHRAVLALAEEHGGLEAFADLFEEAINGHINQSDFLLGKSESKFRCTLNWILGMTKNKDAFDNVISGAYDGAEREDEKPAAQEDDDWNTPLRQDQYVIDDRPFWEREKDQK